MAAKKRPADPLAAARARALGGDAEAAISALRPLAETDAGAAASLAELRAFTGDWAGVADAAARLIASPGSVYASNVFDDMVRLVAIAGHHGVPWSRIDAIAAGGLAGLAAEPRPHVQRRLGTILEELRAYAARAGAPPHERIAVFGVTPSVPSREQCEAAVAAAEKKPKKTPEEQARHLIALAVSHRQADEIVRRVRAAPKAGSFAMVREAAGLLAADGEADAAWALIASRLGDWWPVDVAQVAPVELLTDPLVRELVTKDRAAAVLATPRGRA